MYLYIPLSGRTVNVESYSISSTGIQFDEPVPCLDAVLGTLLRLETDEQLTASIEKNLQIIMDELYYLMKKEYFKYFH